MLKDAQTLDVCHNVELSPAAPFNYDATLHKPDHFPSPDNEWQPGVRWQAMLWQGIPLGLKFTGGGAVDRPRLAMAVFSSRELSQAFIDGLLAEIRCRYSLDMDLAEFNRRFASDPALERVIQRWKGMRPLNCSSLYEYLMIAIVLQNATVRRSVSMMRALLEAY